MPLLQAKGLADTPEFVYSQRRPLAVRRLSNADSPTVKHWKSHIIVTTVFLVTATLVARVVRSLSAVLAVLGSTTIPFSI